jgi:hypothetical protein
MGVSAGIDLVSPPLSIAVFGGPIIHKHLSNPLTRRGMKYVISGFAVLHDNQADIDAEQLKKLTTRYNQLLGAAEDLTTRGTSWIGAILMNSEAHKFKFEAKNFHYMAVRVSQAGQMSKMTCPRTSNSDPQSGSRSPPPTDPNVPSDQSPGETDLGQVNTSANQDECFTAIPDDSAASTSDSPGDQQVVPKSVFVVLDPFEDDPVPHSPPASPVQPSSKEYVGYYMPRSGSTVSFVSV